jgi:chitinase
MSYDMHGLWDKTNEWTGPFLNAHTNLTEIEIGLDLLWRNNIDPNQVVMGIGFYGRAFTASSVSCMQPTCTFSEAGKPGRCSNEAGILTISEITDIIKSQRLKPHLFKQEMVKAIVWDNQWVAYDDSQTFIMKADYARSLCISGLMVWAVTHDMDDGRYSIALGEAAGRNNLKPVRKGKLEPMQQWVDRKQCRWTNCGQSKNLQFPLYPQHKLMI